MSKAERIAFVCPRFSRGGTVGGAETLIKNLAQRAAAAGRSVSLLTTCATNHVTWENELPPGQEQVDGIRVHYFPTDDRDLPLYLRMDALIGRKEPVTDEQESAWIRNSGNSRALCEHLQSYGEEYDRIVAGPYLFGLTYVAAQVHPEKTWLVPCLHDEPCAYLRIMRRLFGAVAGCMFNSEPERDLARRLFELSDTRSPIVGMGVGAFDADPHALARDRGLQTPYVVYSGRREAGKGTPLLCDYLHAFRQRTGRDVKLVLTGSGDVEAPPGLREHIVDLGFVDEQTKREAMAGAVAFVHPSTLESLGIVLLESWMARTSALVHAKSPVLRWQCERSNAGLWFGNYPEFEEELNFLLDRPDAREALGRAGRAYVLREYTWERVEARMFEALDA